MGEGYSREEVKTEILNHGISIVSTAVTTPLELACEILNTTELDNVSTQDLLGSVSRQEVLRDLLRDPRVLNLLPRIKHLKRKRGFYKKLDQALQSGRKTFAHEAELDAIEGRLHGFFGESVRRKEVQALAHAYEAWLMQMKVWDEALLYTRAVQVLQASDFDPGFLSQRIYRLQTGTIESRMASFWDELSRHVEIVQVDVRSFGSEVRGESPYSWRQWHAIDDAAEYLAEHLSEHRHEIDWSLNPILIPDVPEIRRAVVRALKRHRVALADPRDPTRIRWEEGLKSALLPLEIVSSRFAREFVVPWIQENLPSRSAELVHEISQLGIQDGLHSYRHHKLEGVYEPLEILKESFSSRMTLKELSHAHLQSLAQKIHHLDSTDLVWVYDFFKSSWASFGSDMERLGKGTLKAPLVFWLSRLKQRIEQEKPPAEKFKHVDGVPIYRLDQMSVRFGVTYDNLWILGLPSNWLDGRERADYWYTSGERENLSAEFLVRSGIQTADERKSSLEYWVEQSKQVHILDAEFTWGGKERESILPALTPLEAFKLESPEPMGCAPAWLHSYHGVTEQVPDRVCLASARGDGIEGDSGPARVRATELDRYSRCGFQGLAAYRWRLRDLREPEIELWPDVRGRILHKAVELLLEKRDSEGRFDLSVENALDRAWVFERPKGLIPSERMKRETKKKLIVVLQAFCEKEREYVSRSRTSIEALEPEEDIVLTFPEGEVYGRPDRIDRHEDGLFVIDFKATSSLPSGKDMIEDGYRLQLPFYGLGVKKGSADDLVGMQLIQLTRKANRNTGIFFSKYNGKTEGALTNTRSKLNVFSEPESQVLAQCEKQIQDHLKAYLGGDFEARPKKETECRSCPYRDVCGERRRIEGTL